MRIAKTMAAVASWSKLTGDTLKIFVPKTVQDRRRVQLGARLVDCKPTRSEPQLCDVTQLPSKWLQLTITNNKYLSCLYQHTCMGTNHF